MLQETESLPGSVAGSLNVRRVQSRDIAGGAGRYDLPKGIQHTQTKVWVTCLNEERVWVRL